MRFEECIATREGGYFLPQIFTCIHGGNPIANNPMFCYSSRSNLGGRAVQCGTHESDRAASDRGCEGDIANAERLVQSIA